MIVSPFPGLRNEFNDPLKEDVSGMDAAYQQLPLLVASDLRDYKEWRTGPRISRMI